jgi:hypothetical protein
MKRARLLALSSVLAVASGALVFACSGDDTKTDGGTDAKADTTTQDSGKDATADAANDAQGDGGGGDAASDASDGGGSDAGAGLTFMVVRVGGDVDAGGTSALTNASTQVFLEERAVSDGSLVRTLALPTAASGQNQPLTVSGTATSEGLLTTATDGKSVVLAGYAAAPGVTAIAKTSAIDGGGALRVVGRVDHAGSIDTTTELAAFDTSNIRGAATVDGGSFWASGTSGTIDAGLAGVQYVALGSTGATTNLFDYNVRMVGIFGGQLYLSAQLPPYNGVATVGTGTPTTAGQTVTLLPGFPDGDAGSSPTQFSMLKLDGSVGPVDTLYIADEASQANGGGIQKWVYDGMSWTKIATFTDGASTGFRGVMAVPSGSNVIVLGVTSSSNANLIVKYVDDGANTNPTGTTLATAPTNTVYRGIAVPPQ